MNIILGSLLRHKYFSFISCIILDIRPSDTVALGDIGYWTDAGEFIVVDNVHHSLQAESGTLSWEAHIRFRSGSKELGDTSADIIVSRSGKSYQRWRQVHFPVSSDLLSIIVWSSILRFRFTLRPTTTRLQHLRHFPINQRRTPGLIDDALIT